MSSGSCVNTSGGSSPRRRPEQIRCFVRRGERIAPTDSLVKPSASLAVESCLLLAGLSWEPATRGPGRSELQSRSKPREGKVQSAGRKEEVEGEKVRNRDMINDRGNERKQARVKPRGSSRTKEGTLHALSLGASVPSASAVVEASDHRPSVLGATG
jgi:hypothetical protein